MKNRACPVASIANKSLKRIELIVRTQLHSIDLICPKASLFITAFLTIAGPPADAVVIESWVQRYDGPAHGDDQARAVAVDSSGNVVVTGASDNGTNNDYYTARYAAANGVLLWENRYNGPGNFDDEASAVAVDKSGNVVVTGYSGDSGTNNYYTAKYAAASGALLWEKRGPGGGLLVMDGSGNVVVTGSSYNGTNYHFYSAKYAATDGALLWEHYYRWSTNSDEFVTGVAVDGNGNVAVTGYTWTNADYYTAKYAAADGTLLWEKRYNGPANRVDMVSFSGGLALGPNGIVAITGSVDGWSAGGWKYDYGTVVYRENLPPVSIALVPAGIRLSFPGVAGLTYTIERAPAVTGPWNTITTPTAPLNAFIEYVDTNAPAGSAFYRTHQP